VTLEEAVLTRLQALPALEALVATRIFQLKLPEHVVVPAVRVQLVSEQMVYHLRGGRGVRWGRVQVDAYAGEASGGDPYAEAAAVAGAIDGDARGDEATGLSGWRGVIGSPPLFRILFIARDDRGIDYEAEERRLVRVRQDYLVWFRDEPTLQ
jgi:hypothetical protein